VYEAETMMERIQILLEPTDRNILKQLADEAHTSMSNIVRDLLRARLKEQSRARLRKAAEIMAT
jgi:DNA-binding transcriptional ArsR family regulator